MTKVPKCVWLKPTVRADLWRELMKMSAVSGRSKEDLLKESIDLLQKKYKQNDRGDL